MRDCFRLTIIYNEVDHLLAGDELSVLHQCINDGGHVWKIPICLFRIIALVLFGRLCTNISQLDSRLCGV